MRIYALVRKQNAPMFWGAVIGGAAALGSALLSSKAARDTAGTGV